MKWIGQHIWDLISRFRSKVYLEDVDNAGSDTDAFLVKKTNGEVAVRTGAEVLSDIGGSSGDITGVTITTDSGGGSAASDTSGSADFSILGSNGVGVTNSGTTITATAVPGEIDHDSLQNYESNEHFTMVNIVATGTIAAGTWEGNDVGVAHGGTGLSTVGTDEILTGNGTSSLTSESALTFASEVLTIGDDDAGTATIQRQTHSDGNGGNLKIAGGNATNGQTNKSGGTLGLYAGTPTGNGAWGNIAFFSGTVGASGTSIGAAREIAIIKSTAATSNDFVLFEPYDGSADNFTASVQANGVTTLSTSDSDGTVGHLTLDADGDITLDAASGNVYVKDNGGNYTPGSDYEIATKKYVDDNAGGSDGWHGSTTRIKILPRDFQADDIGRPVMTEDDTTDERYLFSHGSGKMYASIPIPTGYKATHVKIHGSDTGQTHTTYEANIANKDVVEKGSATAIETEKAITNVTSSITNYLLIEVSSDGTDEIHGGYVKIEAV